MYVSDCIQIIVLGYGLGSIPFGILLAKLFRLPDPRTIGSGNMGATNMLRTGNKKVALLTLLLDMGKGVAAVGITNALFTFMWTPDFGTPACFNAQGRSIMCPIATINPHYTALAVLLAAIGHMYCPWLKFKGGKGVATLFGGALAFSWPVGMGALFVWCMVFFTKRYVSLASIITLAIAPLIAWLRVDGTSALIIGIASAIAIWKHRDNIYRLRHGMEPRMTFGKQRNL